MLCARLQRLVQIYHASLRRRLNAPLEDPSALRPWPLPSRRPWAWFASWSKTRPESAKGQRKLRLCEKARTFAGILLSCSRGKILLMTQDDLAVI
jgi:hypothetical protein